MTSLIPATPQGIFKKGAAAVTMIEGAHKLYSMSKAYLDRTLSFTVTVSERDSLYSEIHTWLVGVLPNEKHRAVTVHTSSVNRYSDSESIGPSGETAPPKKLTVRYNDKNTRVILVDGHRIRVSLNTPDTGGESMNREPPPAQIHFSATTHQGQKAVLAKLEEINASRSRRRNPVLKLVSQWGNWTTRGDLPPRTMDSVTLPVEQKARIIADLRSFLDAEEQYNRLAIPWHRGYMFHGPPGTGKTSLAKALANEFKLDIWYISLSDLKQEASLLGLLSEVAPRSILLLEDIDTIKITHDRDSAESGNISMSSLLNTLDGVATPHGLITIMSTNRFELLDPALTRAGRMDLVELLDYPTVASLIDMYRHFYGKLPPWTFMHPDAVFRGVSTAQIAEIMKNHMYDSDLADRDILALANKIPEFWI